MGLSVEEVGIFGFFKNLRLQRLRPFSQSQAIGRF